MVNIANSRLFIIIFGISTAKSKFSLAGARITNLPLITMIASQAKHKQNRVCLIEIYCLCDIPLGSRLWQNIHLFSDFWLC